MPGHVHDAMSTVVLTIGPAHTLRQAAQLMSARRVGAAVVLDPDTSGLGILTERDILNSLGAGQDPDLECAHDHTTTAVVFASPSWTLHEAAHAMCRGGFRHLIVLGDREPVGVVSVRDIVRSWSAEDVRRADGPEGPEPSGVRPLRVGSAGQPVP
ncbi:cyclic nucleotide-binding/CBS domain-containing protein [Streptomyces boncukensis]|uniref:CBS domain-containing protein n=1 Tax=Streptomyces boncukensis TaxID=2711219 RepID=A0A6G4WRC1_9ACTN|nr:CBS domain-containing protein [Streptomyces boncukensis]NGO67382.1 CBS domain-containing protein [Streptomyces boncukensis]